MNFLSRINPAIVDSSAMQSPTEATNLGLDEVLLETTVPLPRTIPIPNAHAKDPASYASHTSKLNPENSVTLWVNGLSFLTMENRLYIDTMKQHLQ